MHTIYLSDGRELFKPKTSRLEIIVKTVFIVAILINVGVAKTKASFLVLEPWIVRGIMLFLIIVPADY